MTSSRISSVEYEGRIYYRIPAETPLAKGDISVASYAGNDLRMAQCNGVEYDKLSGDKLYPGPHFRFVDIGQRDVTVNESVRQELTECQQELEETQEDLASICKENDALTAAVSAMKPPDDKALQQHVEQLAGRLQQAESILMALALATGGYHGSR